MASFQDAVADRDEYLRALSALHATAYAQEQQLKGIIEAAPVSLMVLNRHGMILAANHAARDMRSARGMSDLVGKNVSETIARHDRERFAQFVASVCAGTAGSLQYELLPLMGPPYPAQTDAVPLWRDVASAPVFLGITHDVSERSRAECVLRRMEEKCRALEAERAAGQARRASIVRLEGGYRHQALVERDSLVARLREADRLASSVEQVCEPSADEAQLSMFKRLWQKRGIVLHLLP